MRGQRHAERALTCHQASGLWLQACTGREEASRFHYKFLTPCSMWSEYLMSACIHTILANLDTLVGPP